MNYVELNGLVFRHQSSGTWLQDVDHFKILQCGFEDSANGNNATFELSTGSSNVLIEDCYAWGGGRYKFLIGSATNVVLRRDVARFDRVDAHNPDTGGNEPIASFAIYGATNVEVQNCISIDGDQDQFWLNIGEYGGSYYMPKDTAHNVNIRGSMALNVAMPFGTVGYGCTNIKYFDTVGWDVSQGNYDTNSDTYDHVTFGGLNSSWDGGAMYGVRATRYFTNTTTDTVTNSLFTQITGSGAVALKGVTNENYNVFWQNTADRAANDSGALPTGTGAQSANANPGLKYILRTSDGSSAVVGKASDGGNIGANIVYQTGVSGTLYGETGYNTLTNIPLWPWPNEAIIGAMMRSYSYTDSTGTLSGNRGFAATGQTLTNYIWTYLGNANPYAGTPTAPAAPSNLAATATSATQINLTWTDNATNETGFVLERQIGSGAWTQIASLAAGVTSYSDTGLTASTQYGYRVMATNSAGDSASSNVANVMTAAPSAPGDANGDGIVNRTDLGVLAMNFGKNVIGGGSQGDFNCDGKVDMNDLLILAQHFSGRMTLG